MLKQIRQRLRVGPTEAPLSVGADQRLYAIGDVHGRADLLEQLLEKIYQDNKIRGEVPQWQMVFLGDLIDRGPESRRVVEVAIQLAAEIPCVTLMGNHEEVMVASLNGNLDALRLFLRFGGYETLQSYGVPDEILERASIEEILQAALAIIPAEHQAFLKGLPSKVEFGDYLFVHAGIRPGVALDKQVESDLHWIRKDFLEDGTRHAKMVVHGHTIAQDVDERPNRICIDTGAYYSGQLTAVCLQDTERWYLQT